MWPSRVGHRHIEALGMQEFGKPAAHLAAAADHQCRLAGTLALGADPGLLLVGKR